jgi:hypothetical protein
MIASCSGNFLGSFYSSFSDLVNTYRSVNQNITFTFNESITKGTGFISIRTGSGTGTVIEQLDVVSSNKISINGSTLTIDPSFLEESTIYYITMGAGVIKDLSGNNYAGVTTYDFKTTKSVFDHLFVADPKYGYGTRYETSDIKVPGTVILGTLGDDDLYGTAGVDYVAGYRGLDVIITYGGNDVIYPSINKSNGDAGDGIDILVIGRTLANSTIQPYLLRNPDAVLAKGVSVKNKLDPNVFSDFNNVERLQFSDGTMAIDVAAGQNAGQAYRLYQAAFARTPDMPGVKYHLNDMESNGLPLWQIASNFLASPEFSSKYGANPNDTQYINALYKNVLNRAPGGSEVAWYQNQFNTKAMDRQAALIGFSESPENVALVGSAIANGIWLG